MGVVVGQREGLEVEQETLVVDLKAKSLSFKAAEMIQAVNSVHLIELQRHLDKVVPVLSLLAADVDVVRVDHLPFLKEEVKLRFFFTFHILYVCR